MQPLMLDSRQIKRIGTPGAPSDFSSDFFFSVSSFFRNPSGQKLLANVFEKVRSEHFARLRFGKELDLGSVSHI